MPYPKEVSILTHFPLESLNGVKSNRGRDWVSDIEGVERLQENTLRVLLLGCGRFESGDDCLSCVKSRSWPDFSFETRLIEDILKLILGQCRTLNIFDSSKLLGHAFSVLLSDRGHLLSGKLLANGGVIAKIGLGSDDQAGDAGAVVVDLGEPFLADVFEGSW